MSRIPKHWRILAVSAVLAAFFTFLFQIYGTREKAWQRTKSDLTEKNAELNLENERLQNKIADLKKQNTSLMKYLQAYETNFIALKDTARNCYQMESGLAAYLPEGLAQEPFEVRRIYRGMLGEKKRWDQYQQDQYRNVLETTVEPQVVEAQGIGLKNEDNREYFLELEEALKLHKRLIRDVRLFHDEIRYQQKQLQAQKSYQLYDLKFKLAPFARESALVDALQQAMSALSSGIYQNEAEEVLDRIGDEFTRPIEQLYEQRQEADDPLVSTNYNFNFFTLYGKKLMDYSDSLVGQSSIALGPAAFGELDYFNRRLYDSLYDLYLVGQDETIDPSHLDLDELEQVLYPRN